MLQQRQPMRPWRELQRRSMRRMWTSACFAMSIIHMRRRSASSRRPSRRAKSLVPQYPLPPQQRQVVKLLPVGKRIHIREKVLADKVTQKTIGLRMQQREGFSALR